METISMLMIFTVMLCYLSSSERKSWTGIQPQPLRCRCSAPPKFGFIKRVDKGSISTVKDLESWRFERQHFARAPPLISLKRDKNIGNFLVRRAFKSDNQSGTFKCKRTRCKRCPFLTWLRSQDPIDPLKSLTTSHTSAQMSSIA